MWLFLLKAQLVSYIFDVDKNRTTRKSFHKTFDEGIDHGVVNCKQCHVSECSEQFEQSIHERQKLS